MLASLIVGVLVAVRDFLIAAALAWIGVSVERVEYRVDGDRACAVDSCQQQSE